MKKQFKMIVFIFLILLIITLNIIGSMSKDHDIIIISFITMLILVLLLILIRAISYAKARKWLYMILVFIFLTAYSCLFYKNMLIGFELSDVYVEREKIEIQIRNEENEIEREKLYDDLGELFYKSTNLNTKRNLYGFLQYLSIVMIVFLPSNKKNSIKEDNYNE